MRMGDEELQCARSAVVGRLGALGVVRVAGDGKCGRSGRLRENIVDYSRMKAGTDCEGTLKWKRRTVVKWDE